MTAWAIAGYALGSAAALVLIVAGLALGWLTLRTHRLQRRGQYTYGPIATPIAQETDQ